MLPNFRTADAHCHRRAFLPRDRPRDDVSLPRREGVTPDRVDRRRRGIRCRDDAGYRCAVAVASVALRPEPRTSGEAGHGIGFVQPLQDSSPANRRVTAWPSTTTLRSQGSARGAWTPLDGATRCTNSGTAIRALIWENGILGHPAACGSMSPNVLVIRRSETPRPARVPGRQSPGISKGADQSPDGGAEGTHRAPFVPSVPRSPAGSPDISGTFQGLSALSQGLSAVQKGKPVTELKAANHLVRAWILSTR